MDKDYKIKLSVFEGPMDILLALIKDNKINIYDIPISFITNQYLEYLKIMKELNLEIAGEFLVMASTLIYIKSRMLLPSTNDANDDEEEDPRIELVQRLIEYQFYKESALVLKERQEEWKLFLARPDLPLPDFQLLDDDVVIDKKNDTVDPESLGINLYDILNAFNKILQNAPPETATITKETLTVKDKIGIIIDRLGVISEMDFNNLFNENTSRIEIITIFLAMLELLKLGVISVHQREEFSSIMITKKKVEAYDNHKTDYE